MQRLLFLGLTSLFYTRFLKLTPIGRLLPCYCLLLLLMPAIHRSPASAQLIPNYTSSWVGNSFGGGYTTGRWMQNRIHDLAVHPDGRVMVIAISDEGKKGVGLYRNGAVYDNGWRDGNGTLVGGFGNNQTSRPSGWTGCFHPTQEYMYCALGGNETQVRRWNLSGSITPANTLAFNVGFEPQGLATNGTILVASGASSIKTFNVNTGIEIGSFTVSNAGEVVIDAGGDIWAITGNLVREYSPTGTVKNTINRSGWKPVDLAFDNQQRLMIADDGPTHVIRFYTTTGTPTQVDTLGTSGGIKAGTPGAVTNNKFWGLTGCGCDSAGNYYVAMSQEGAIVRCFNSQKQLQWQLAGLHFIDVVVADPTTAGADVYGRQEHYRMNYNLPVGKQWTLQGYSLDLDTYPQDIRGSSIGDKLIPAWCTYVNNKKFLYMTDMIGLLMAVFRFNGEIAIPSVVFCRDPQPWAPGSPSGPWIWKDLDGAGDFDSNEFTTGTGFTQANWWVDSQGTITVGNGTNIVRFPATTTDGVGNPNYAFSSSSTRAVPTGGSNPAWNNIKRTAYDVDTDVMIISGYTTQNPIDEWPFGGARSMGPTIARYNNWSQPGSTSLAWSRVLEHTPAETSWEDQLQPRGFDFSATANASGVISGHIFVSYASFGPDNGPYYGPIVTRGEVKVLNLANGNDVGYMVPQAALGGPGPTPNEDRPTIVGAQDIVQPITVFRRSNGTYFIFQEEDKWSKVMFYQWTP
jgi:hypothetical protein